MRKFLLSLVLLVCALPSFAFGHSYFTREPAGSIPIAECNMNAVDICNAVKGFVQLGRWYDLYSNAIINNDGSEPGSPSGYLDSILPYSGTCIGPPPLACAVGGGQIGYIDNKVDREMFVGLTFRVNANYTCSSVGKSKTFFMRTMDNPSGFQQTNGVFLIEGCGTTKSWIFSHNSSQNDNTHICALDLGLACYPNVGSGSFAVNTWVRIEVCMRSSDSISSRNGVLKFWMNGNPVMSYTNLNYGSGNVNEFVQNETWDGYGNGQGFTAEARQQFGHVYISAPPSGGCAATGGGPPPLPIDNPVGPPGTTTVTVTVQ